MACIGVWRNTCSWRREQAHARVDFLLVLNQQQIILSCFALACV